MLTPALLFVLTRLLDRYAQELLELHECIVAEYIYAERAKDGATGLLAFASAVSGKILGKKSRWPVKQLGEPLFALGEAAFRKRVTKLLAPQDKLRASASAVIPRFMHAGSGAVTRGEVVGVARKGKKARF
jgi:hypothetical protein